MSSIPTPETFVGEFPVAEICVVPVGFWVGKVERIVIFEIDDVATTQLLVSGPILQERIPTIGNSLCPRECSAAHNPEDRCHTARRHCAIVSRCYRFHCLDTPETYIRASLKDFRISSLLYSESFQQ